MGLGDDIRKGVAKDFEQEAARKIINAIDKWRKGGKTSIAQKRWLFELTQNALDTAKGRKNDNLRIEIDVPNNDVIIFRHNAGYFDPRELRALIYAYSTKPYERKSELTGRFATGFLVTHIVSRKVQINGFINKEEEIYSFTTTIDRESDNINGISQSIKDSFKGINEANKVTQNDKEFWTEYKYSADDDTGRKAIEEGILNFKEIIPFLSAFNNINRITINNESFEHKTENYKEVHIITIGTKQVWIRENQKV